MEHAAKGPPATMGRVRRARGNRVPTRRRPRAWARPQRAMRGMIKAKAKDDGVAARLREALLDRSAAVRHFARFHLGALTGQKDFAPIYRDALSRGSDRQRSDRARMHRPLRAVQAQATIPSSA
jgi:hypothetical protein